MASFLASVLMTDDSGNWGHEGMFDALAKVSQSVPCAYERASEFKDLHLDDLHLIEIKEDRDDQIDEASLWVALAVVQSYNLRRKVHRSIISFPDLERCISKASLSAAQKYASIHMPLIGYQDGLDRSEWYTVVFYENTLLYLAYISLCTIIDLLPDFGTAFSVIGRIYTGQLNILRSRLQTHLSRLFVFYK